MFRIRFRLEGSGTGIALGKGVLGQREGPQNEGRVMLHRLLLIDDDVCFLDTTREFLEKREFKVELAKSGPEGIAKYKENPTAYSVVIVDYQIPEMNGAHLTESLIQLNPNVFVLVFSGDPSREAFLQPARRGARSFVDKAEGIDAFLREVRRLCVRFEEDQATVRPSFPLEDRSRLIASVGMVGQSQALAAIAERVHSLREKNGPVLILGESGTGKELIARALHGDRKDPFLAVNCADYLLNRDTARSELFGHVRGSFTGAVSDKKGLFEEAGHGTIFLDEVYALPLEAQLGLLRALREKVFSKVGSTEQSNIHCRIVAAAKPDLLDEIARGTFKSDLFYRISQNIIKIPPLRERSDDIEPLVHHFCEQWSQEYQEAKTFKKNTLSWLAKYSWPGNVGELFNVVYSALNSSKESAIDQKDLDARFRKGEVSSTESTGPASLRSHVERAERTHLIEVLAASRSFREAARRLEISPASVLRLIKKHALDKEQLLAGTKYRRGTPE
jgi:DNA-binding NtrC family response regulator